LAEALGVPVRPTDKQETARRVQEHINRFFEEIWIHRPLASLNRIAPIDAAGHPTLRKKLLGAIQFIQDCAAFGPTKDYDFNRLHRKLGLGADEQAETAPAAAAGMDIGAMGAPELAALQPDSLSIKDLDLAFQTALKVDAREIAERFARAIIARPPQADRPDRYPSYSYLIQKASSEGNLDDALDQVNEGEQADCAQNEGRRRNEYELRRGQIHVKRGEFAEAIGVFDRLIARIPSDLKYRGSAVEALLSARQASHALRYAEEGLALARKNNDRDSEGYFMELVEAAKRQK
jgi:tetratricopeptide (TPR) repeat protein